MPAAAVSGVPGARRMDSETPGAPVDLRAGRGGVDHPVTVRNAADFWSASSLTEGEVEVPTSSR